MYCVSLWTKVSTEEGKSFRESFEFIPISFAREISEKLQKYCKKCEKKNAKILSSKLRKKNNYDIIKLLMLRAQSREFHKFFCTINCFRYNTFFRKMFFSQNTNIRIFSRKWDDCLKIKKRKSNLFFKKWKTWKETIGRFDIS